jgi:hypothetical protein
MKQEWMRRKSMAFIQRKWTPVSADNWTKEDWYAIILSPLAYVGLAVGVALSLLLLKAGFIVLGVTIGIIIFMHWIIDPKLKTISEEFEKKQKNYLEQLEKIERWEEIQ